MRIPNKVVCLWSCLTAFTFIHTAVAQDYAAEPLTGAGAAGSVATADYAGSAMLGDAGEDAGYGQEYAPAGYDAGYGDGGYGYGDPYGGGGYVDPAQGYYPEPLTQGYPPQQMMPANPYMNYWPEVSPYEQPIMDKTYRQNGIWMNEGVTGERKYFFSAEYLRTWFDRPGSDRIGDPNVYPLSRNRLSAQPVNASVFANGSDLTSDGARGKFVIQNPDSSTFELSAFWVAEGKQIYRPYPPFNLRNPLNPRNERGFLGLDDGGPFGTRLIFDQDFKLTYKAQAWGGDIVWSTMPVYETLGFKIKPVFGVKYLTIREQFDLFGVQTNFFGGPDPYITTLTSQTKSNLLGPQAAIRYEMGGNVFTLMGQTGLAVMANHETISIYGNNMRDPLLAPIPTPTNPKPNAFRDGQAHTHVSPIFMQDFQFKAKVFRVIPGFNDIPIFANADMLIGYNFLLVGNVARPTKLIDWRVDSPRIDLSHSRWYMQAVTWGLQWQF